MSSGRRRGDRRPPGVPAAVIAHRGAWGPAPQNSLAAFEQAIADGADGVELDVRRTRDGRLVVLHDARIGLRPVHRLTLADLRERVPPGQAPDLDEVLAALAGRTRIDVELKEDGYVGVLTATLRRYLDPGDYLVTSFLDAVLPQVRAMLPDARTGLLLAAGRGAARLERRIREARVDVIAPHLSLVRGGLLERPLADGLPAWVWTVNETDALRDLLADPRVEAVITDHPSVAVELAAGLGGPTES